MTAATYEKFFPAASEGLTPKNIDESQRREF
jgi:hypothetical protein